MDRDDREHIQFSPCLALIHRNNIGKSSQKNNNARQNRIEGSKHKQEGTNPTKKQSLR